MGTTCYAAHNSPQTYAEEKREIETIYSNAGKNTILQAAKVGSVWYLAVKINATGEVWAGVCVTHRHKGEWCYKDMDESMIPYYFDAPASLLKKLSPTTHEGATEWRKNVSEKIAAKKAANAKTGAGSALLNNGTWVNVEGMFGKYHGKDLLTMQCQDRERRQFWSPDAGITFTLKKTQITKIMQRLAEGA